MGHPSSRRGAAASSSSSAEQHDEPRCTERLLALWARFWVDDRPAAIERQLSVEGKRPTRQEISDLSKLWLMLSFRLHGRAGTHGAQKLSGVRLSWGEFQLAFENSWHQARRKAPSLISQWLACGARSPVCGRQP